MASRNNCVVCGDTLFNGRRDAKSCSSRCRKRLQRINQVTGNARDKGLLSRVLSESDGSVAPFQPARESTPANPAQSGAIIPDENFHQIQGGYKGELDTNQRPVSQNSPNAAGVNLNPNQPPSQPATAAPPNSTVPAPPPPPQSPPPSQHPQDHNGHPILTAIIVFIVLFLAWSAVGAVQRAAYEPNASFWQRWANALTLGPSVVAPSTDEAGNLVGPMGPPGPQGAQGPAGEDGCLAGECVSRQTNAPTTREDGHIHLAGSAAFGGNLDVGNLTTLFGQLTVNADSILNGSLDVNDSLTVVNKASVGSLAVTNATELNDTLTVAGNVLPSANQTYNVGSSSAQWDTVFADTIQGTIAPTGFSSGSVVFAGSDGALTQDNANFFWDDANNRLGLATSSPSSTLHVGGTATAQHILPETDDTFDLGSSTKRWRDLFTGPGTIHIGADGDEAQLAFDTANDLLTFQNSADSTTGFQFQNAAGTNILNIDTTNQRVGIGTNSPSGTLEIGSGQLLLSDGSDSAPAFAFSNDTGTGFILNEFSQGEFRHSGSFSFRASNVGTVSSAYNFGTHDSVVAKISESSGDLVFEPDNTEQMRITTSGNLGLATTTPDGILDIEQDGSTIYFQPDTVTTDGGAKNSPTLTFRGKHDSDGTTGVTSTKRALSFQNITEANGNYRLGLLDNGGTEFVTFEGDTQRVGIGTTEPAELLDILAGDNAGKDAFSRFKNDPSESGSRTWNVGVPYNGDGTTGGLNFDFAISDTDQSGPQFLIEWDTGNVGVGTASPNELLHVSGTRGAIALTDTDSFTDANDWLYLNPAVDKLNFGFRDDSAGTNTDILTVDGSTNRVGIGQLNPNATLDVGGGVKVNGVLDMNGNTLSLDNGHINNINSSSTSGTTLIRSGSGHVRVSSSSKRFKKNIEGFNDYWRIINTLGTNTASFMWEHDDLPKEERDDQRRLGSIAEWVMDEVPELIIWEDEAARIPISISYKDAVPSLAAGLVEQRKQLTRINQVIKTANAPTGTSSLVINNQGHVLAKNSLHTPDLNVTQMATVKKLKVTEAATIKNLTVTDTVETADLVVDGHIIGNSDTRGEIVVDSGIKKATQEFDVPYKKQPNVVATPTNAFAPSYRIEADKSGFTIYLQEPASEDTKFNYQVQQ